jgi:hypothetical protein
MHINHAGTLYANVGGMLKSWPLTLTSSVTTPSAPTNWVFLQGYISCRSRQRMAKWSEERGEGVGEN